MTTEQLIFQFAQPATYNADDFLTADCNREAHRWITGVGAWPGHALVLHGPAFSGKTHLAHIWAAGRDAVIADAARLEEGDVPRLAAHDVVVEMADRMASETAMFHLYNLLREEGRKLLLLARRPPAGWGIVLPDLASRIAATPAVAIGDPDAELVPPLLVKLCRDRQLTIPPEVAVFLAPRLERSFSRIAETVEKLDQLSMRHGKRVTVPLARQVLQQTEQSSFDV